MQRYKILLVDDETDVRQSIARTVDWEAEGFVLCGCAGGALEAMELARRLLPDVVMTDICMPYMDGLELTERLRELYPAMQFVIVSGYDEFEYAQRAVKAQVMDYLLKPLSADGVREALRRIRAKLDSNMARSRDLESLREEARQDRLQLERTQLMELLLEARGETGEALKAERYFPARLALMELAGAPENERVLQEDFQGDRMLLDFSLQQLAQELLQEGDQGICVLHRGRLVVLLREEEDVLRLAERVADTLRMVLGLSVKTAMSCRMEDARMLPGMYQRALLLVGNEATYDAGSVFLMEEELQQDAALRRILRPHARGSGGQRGQPGAAGGAAGDGQVRGVHHGAALRRGLGGAVPRAGEAAGALSAGDGAAAGQPVRLCLRGLPQDRVHAGAGLPAPGRGDRALHRGELRRCESVHPWGVREVPHQPDAAVAAVQARDGHQLSAICAGQAHRAGKGAAAFQRQEDL